jgi:hypothetical protein
MNGSADPVKGIFNIVCIHRTEQKFRRKQTMNIFKHTKSPVSPPDTRSHLLIYLLVLLFRLLINTVERLVSPIIFLIVCILGSSLVI